MIAIAAGMAVAAAAAAQDRCQVPVALPRSRVAPRSVTAEDLVALRDIGSSQASIADEKVFSVSPDGRRAAFQIHRADPAANRYCVALVVIELRPNARRLTVDRGNELIRFKTTFRNRLDYPYGLVRTITPRWSPDGRSIAYLKQSGGTPQAWLAFTDGSGARPLTNLPEGVDDVRFSDDGHSLIIASRPDRPDRYQGIEAEGRSGWRYDERFAPMMTSRPFPPGPAPTTFRALDLSTGALRAAAPKEAEDFATDAVDGVNQGSTHATATTGDVAILTPDSEQLVARRQRLSVRRADGTILDCTAAECRERISSQWWTPDGGQVLFLRREGENNEISSVYAWRPGSAPPRRIFTSRDLLLSCEPASHGVACMRETPTRPRHLVLLNPGTGRLTPVFDPNPELSTLRMGRVERLQLHDAFGVPLFAHIVLPVEYRKDRRYPLVVVQYNSRGFLRGGTGDEYPIQAFAGRGFAVLSMDRPNPLAYAPGAASGVEVDKALLKDFRYRKGVHSTIEAAIDTLVKRGVADPSRVGLTGLSEGASEVQYALIHDRRFAAAAMSGCCWGPQTMPLTGLVAAKQYVYKGYPSWADPGGSAFWRELSLVPHAREMDTPLLIQASDDELLDAVDAYTALQLAGAPVDLFVFPDEHHVKWHPAHRLAVYRRNLQWFDFWLRNDTSPTVPPAWRAWKHQPSAYRPLVTAADWTRRVVPDQ